MAAYALTRAGARVVMLEAGPEWWATKNNADAASQLRVAAARRRDARAPVRRVRRVRRRMGDRGRAVHRAPGHRVRLVARAHARRPHEPLGTHLAALRPRRLQGKEHRRPRRRLADRLRRRHAVLRPRRRARSGSSAATKGCGTIPTASSTPPPKPRCYELLVKKASDKLDITCIPARLSIITKAAQRAAGVPLLRAVQPRLRRQRELLEPGRAASRPRSRPAG